MSPSDRLLAAYQKQNKALAAQLESLQAENESMRTLMSHAGAREDVHDRSSHWVWFPAGYQAHRKRGEDVCGPCGDANREYMRAYMAGRRGGQ